MSEALRSVTVGRFRVTALRDARFALDGGAMFGVVPRAIWQELTPVNADHTIPLATTPYLVEDGPHRVVIEPGLGRRWGAQERAQFHIDHSGGHELVESLARAGVAPRQVSHCLLTHGHWDHAGAACGPDGEPLFRNAVHWTPDSELRAALDPDQLRRASYRAADLQPLVAAGLLRTFAATCEPLPGLSMVEVGGHSDGVSLVLIRDAGATACFWSDVLPTRHHAPLPYIMAYDQNAAASYAVRCEWIPRAAAEGWINLLYHDPETPIVRLVRDGRRYAARLCLGS